MNGTYEFLRYANEAGAWLADHLTDTGWPIKYVSEISRPGFGVTSKYAHAYVFRRDSPERETFYVVGAGPNGEWSVLS